MAEKSEYYYLNNNGGLSDSPHNSASQLSIPVTLSILISNSLFLTRLSPASTLILPFYRLVVPYGYFLIIFIDLITAFWVQATYLPLTGASSFRGNVNQALPDIYYLRQVYSLTKVNNSPLFPKGMTINFSVSSPFTEPNSITTTLFTLQLIEIKKIPGFVVAVLTLFLYWFLYPSLKPLEANNNGNNNSRTNP
ncbi:MAG: hypothetical protein AWM53_01915 [Candidatus Dichloromethanomonas elyunquensis]|nr:MAG: hypothetical protein AWM53_01915 [Candidatus Dichloromethanomonas elyunquensis]